MGLTLVKIVNRPINLGLVLAHVKEDVKEQQQDGGLEGLVEVLEKDPKAVSKDVKLYPDTAILFLDKVYCTNCKVI